jgi:nitronate monooxygenase
VRAASLSDHATARRSLRDLARHPLVVSPMAGGPSTPALVAAASAAGALGFLAGGYKTPDALREEMASVREAGVAAFGVNVFVPGAPVADRDAVTAYLADLEPEAAALGGSLGEPAWDDDHHAAKLEVVLAEPPAVVSFTFGVPAEAVVAALRRAGSLVLLTVTTPEEAMTALRAAPDGLCLQGAEAGAHRGSFANDDRPDQDRPVRALLAAVRRRTTVPLVAAGGVRGPADVAGLLAAGATLVQAGTAFLRCPESGAHPRYKDALGDEAFTTAGFDATEVTRAFSGRRARALANAMVRAHRGAPAAYPEINNATRPLRAAAAAAADAGHMSLYAGTGFRQAEARPAAEVVARLVSAVGP